MLSDGGLHGLHHRIAWARLNAPFGAWCFLTLMAENGPFNGCQPDES